MPKAGEMKGSKRFIFWSSTEKAISDGYSGLKALISKKFVGQSDVTDVIEKLQAHSHFGRLDIILNSSRVRT